MTPVSIDISFTTPVFSRYIKLHSSLHRMDSAGNSLGSGNLIEIDKDAIIVEALSGGSNEFYTYRKLQIKIMRKVTISD